MANRRPSVPGARRYDYVIRTVRHPGEFGEDCRMCETPLAYGQRVMLSDHLDWVHMGCQARLEQVKAGQLSLWS